MIMAPAFDRRPADPRTRAVRVALRSRLRPSDTAARTGGDEFVFLLPFTAVDHARAVVARVIDALPIACSFGLADRPDGTTFEEATRVADREMYADKGRNSS